MSKQYEEYLTNHINNVKKSYLWLKENLYNELFSHLTEEKINHIDELIEKHDLSKYSEEEYNAYDKYFYSYERSKSIKTNFDYAWNSHIHNNKHHWQHWILITDDNGLENPIILDMPYEYILEMICDWWSFSWNKGNLHEIFNWYDENNIDIQLSYSTRKTVEYILISMRKKLNELEIKSD